METWIGSKNDPRVKAVFAQWARCMRKHGHRYNDPMEANNDRRFKTTAPSEPEIATAVADVACKHAVNVVGVWYAVETAYQRHVVSVGGAGLAAIARNKDAQLAAARRALNER